jgi:AcrR family transcriptional regulator
LKRKRVDQSVREASEDTSSKRSRMSQRGGTSALRSTSKVHRKNENRSKSNTYHHGNLRAALIEAGLKALEDSKQPELSLRELARRVGVSANAAYRHFANKNALLDALAVEGLRRLHATTAEAGARLSDPRASNSASGLAYVQFAIDNPALFHLIFGPYTALRKDPEWLVASMNSLQASLKRTAESSKLDSTDPRLLLQALANWCLVHGLSQLILDGQLNAFSGDDPAGLAKRILEELDVPIYDQSKTQKVK